MGESMSNILLLSPGAYAALGQMGVQALNPGGGSEYSINGQPVGGANFTLDGTDNTGQTLGYIVVNPAPNSIQEAKSRYHKLRCRDRQDTGRRDCHADEIGLQFLPWTAG